VFKFSVFIPTYNAGKWLKKCLDSIYYQNYPKEKIEVIIVDGGSSDNTKEIASRYPVKFHINKRKLAHYAFTIYGELASGDLTVMFAADNELVGNDWFSTVNDCFESNLELAAAWGRIVADKHDAAVNHYFSLIQSEPLSYFLNKNISYYLERSQSVNSKEKEINFFRMDSQRPLVWGANGLVLRYDFVKKYFLEEDFIGDNDIFQKMIEENHDLIGYIPNLNIIHHHVSSVREWRSKLKRNYFQHFLKHRKKRNLNWIIDKFFFKKLFIWFFYAGIPVFSGIHALFLAVKNKNKYWLYHPILSFLQFVTYSWLTVSTQEGRGFIKDVFLKKAK